MSKKKYTKEEKREFSKRNRGISLFTSIIVGMFVALTGYFIYNILKLKGIEDLIRYVAIAGLTLLCLVVIVKNFKLKSQPKKYKFIVLILLLVAFGFGEYYLSHIISRGVSIVDNLNKDEVKYTSALVKMRSNENVTKKNIDQVLIGRISDEEDIEGYVLSENLIDKHGISGDNIIDYDEYITMIRGLYSGEIDAAFLPGSYATKYNSISDFENIADDVETIDKYSKMMKKQKTKETKESNKGVTEPFTILLLGVDSTAEEIEGNGGLGDTLMVVTFNPKTLNATVFSIPRDTYVPISCYSNALSKITHAASGGDSCVISTVENFTGINIDYYAKINFRGLIKLVDAVGGIDVDVPYSFCETDANRMLANTVFVEKGWQHLDGAQALALARNRKYYPTCGPEWNDGDRNDFVRGQNQQIVVKGIIKKLKKIRSVDQFYDILDTVSISLDTNLTREQILGFYNVFKRVLLSSDSLTEGNDVISMQRTYLTGSGGIILDHVAGTGLYEFVPSQNSLDAILTAMRVNLELEPENYATTFSFNIDRPYEQEIIGADIWGGVKHYDPWVAPAETPTVTCGTNEELGADGVTCVCKSGYEKNSAGVCVDKKVNAQCKADEGQYSEADSSGSGCSCLAGYEYDANNQCVEKVIPKTCDDPNADPDNNCACRSGYHSDGGTCVPDEESGEEE